MGIISGQDSGLQFGVETVWGTAVAPTVQAPFTSESIKAVPVYLEEDALQGFVTTNRMDIVGNKTEGDFSMIMKPDVIGLLLSAALGSEAAPAVVGGTSTIYDHVFSCVPGGTSGSLPHLTIVVDRKAAVKGYVSQKINTMTLEAALNDYLRGTFSVRGRNEQTDALESLTKSTKRAFQFRDGNIQIDDVNTADITNFRLTVNNNLEDNLFTMDSSAYMQEIEPQKREITIDLEVQYSSTNDTTRTNLFLTGTTAKVEAILTSTEEAGESENYTLTVELPLAYLIAADPNIGGPERITIPMTFKASQDASNEPITITLRDDQSTKYIT
jgi:hypothetical protein